MLVSPCGIICDECPYYQKECKGCRNLDGQVFWSADVTEKGICPLYDCSVNSKELGSCGKCNELPCTLYYTMKDPDSTEEQHQESIIKRVDVLKSNT
ncbi:MAG: DUF3795 domain-containing protein [Bacteroidales bacterium]